MRRGSGCACTRTTLGHHSISLRNDSNSRLSQSAVVSSISVQALISRGEAAIRFRKPQNHV